MHDQVENYCRASVRADVDALMATLAPGARRAQATRETPLRRMEREGRYTPPAADPSPWPEHPGGPAYTDADVDRLLDETRGDR